MPWTSRPKRAARRDRLIILKLDQALRAFQYAQGGRVPPPLQTYARICCIAYSRFSATLMACGLNANMRVVGTANPIEIRMIDRAAQGHRQPSHRIGHVVMGTGSMVDRMRPPRAVRRSSEHNCAINRAMVEQRNPAGVNDRQHVTENLGLGLCRHLVTDPVLAELLARPLARIAIASDGADAVRFQQRGEFGRQHSRARTADVSP